MEEINVKTLWKVLNEHNILWKDDESNNEYVFMCLSDKPIPLEVKNRIKLFCKFNYPDRAVRFIEAEAVG